MAACRCLCVWQQPQFVHIQIAVGPPTAVASELLVCALDPLHEQRRQALARQKHHERVITERLVPEHRRAMAKLAGSLDRMAWLQARAPLR